MPEIYKIDDGASSVWPALAMNNNGNGGFGRGFLGSLVGGFLGSLFPNLFNGGGFGGFGGGGAAAAALGAQANGNNNTDLVIQAATATGTSATTSGWNAAFATAVDVSCKRAERGGATRPLNH